MMEIALWYLHYNSILICHNGICAGIAGKAAILSEALVLTACPYEILVFSSIIIIDQI